MNLMIAGFLPGGSCKNAEYRGGYPAEHSCLSKLRRQILEFRKSEVTGSCWTEFWRERNNTEKRTTVTKRNKRKKNYSKL